MLVNPMPWAIVLGVLASATGFVLPKPLMGTLSLLADYVPVAFFKLLVHPLLMGGVGLGAIALGLPLARFTLTVLVAALPSASHVSMLAERFGADNGRIARIILLFMVLNFSAFREPWPG